jgi:hypothetical protein
MQEMGFNSLRWYKQLCIFFGWTSAACVVSVTCYRPETDADEDVLNYFIQIDSHVSRTSLSMSNIGQCHTSQRLLSNLQQAITSILLPPNPSRAQNFREIIEILEGVTQKIQLLAKCRIGKSGHASPHLNEIIQYPYMLCVFFFSFFFFGRATPGGLS